MEYYWNASRCNQSIAIKWWVVVETGDSVAAPSADRISEKIFGFGVVLGRARQSTRAK